jgi:hypothetical protein
MSDDSNDWNTSAVLTSAGPVPLPRDPGRDAIAAHINDMLLTAHRKVGPFHLESILTEIGALAGFSAQMALRKGVIEPQNLDPRQILVGAVTKSGETFYFSDAMNWILFERMDEPPYSIWSYVAGAVGDIETLPDVIETVRFAARMVGTREFGVPRVAREHQPHRLPRVSLNENWHAAHESLARAARPPMAWPFDLARAAQHLMHVGESKLALPLAAKLVMEAAIPMAKVDPQTVPGA